MGVLVHRVHKTTAIAEYNCLVRKLNRIFSDKIKTSVGLEIDIFDVHVVFRYCPLNYLDGYYPDYYCADSAEVSDFFLERSHRCISCSIELAGIYTIYSMIIRRVIELQYRDLEKRIVRYLGNKEENKMTYNELYDLHRVIERSKAAFYVVPEIKKVIFNDPATIILWEDGTKTVVKAQDKDQFDKEKGLAMAIVKKALGNEGRYYEIFKKWL